MMQLFCSIRDSRQICISTQRQTKAPKVLLHPRSHWNWQDTLLPASPVAAIHGRGHDAEGTREGVCHGIFAFRLREHPLEAFASSFWFRRRCLGRLIQLPGDT